MSESAIRRQWDIHMVSLEKPWTNEFDQLASKEGWSLFSVNGGKEDYDGRYQIQAVDDPEAGDAKLSGNDGEAYALCCQKALAGSKMHMLALFLDGQPFESAVYVPRCLVE